ncbi:IS21-like element helper ATPase IstB [Sedimenticola hydrogenitrophicus]|uniref:IS21-like element helper ATPase IstB n=1 Tax=Sedimenticola hydrogenitrophicus TaxID=2967975 RepID=UPI0023B173C9|nr:IS21-like element helper ATPase IstB [Sedimenticola hydrogenitrophicus]
MLHNHTLEKLHALKLSGMASAFAQQLAQPAHEELPFEERFALLLDQEILYRDNRRLSRLLKAAKLRVTACVEDIDYRHPRGIDKSFMRTLATCHWVQRRQNLCLTGPTGSGKTWLACALGNQACRQGLSARYFRLPRLFEMLRIAHGDGSYPRLMNQLAKADLLILDDWGIQKIAAAQRNDLMELIEDRHGLKATLIAGQLPVEHWHEFIGEATLADAILDRLLHNAHRLSLRGESMRKKTQKLDGS